MVILGSKARCYEQDQNEVWKTTFSTLFKSIFSTSAALVSYFEPLHRVLVDNSSFQLNRLDS